MIAPNADNGNAVTAGIINWLNLESSVTHCIGAICAPLPGLSWYKICTAPEPFDTLETVLDAGGNDVDELPKITTQSTTEMAQKQKEKK